MIGVISIFLFLLYNIRSNVITLPFTRYEMRRPYFIIYYNDSNSTRAPVSMNLNTYLPYSIINSNHFTIDTSRIGSDIQIPLEDNDTYLGKHSFLLFVLFKFKFFKFVLNEFNFFMFMFFTFKFLMF